jgi:hypothetical protein
MEIVQRLPEDVMLYIIPYTYAVQPKELLEDIRDYYVTLKKAKDIYKKYWGVKGECNCCGVPNEDIDWLINDIFGFINEGVATMIAFVPNFCNLWLRSLRIYSYDQVLGYMKIFEYKPLITQVNMLWGLMKPSERLEFVKEKEMILR